MQQALNCAAFALLLWQFAATVLAQSPVQSTSQKITVLRPNEFPGVDPPPRAPPAPPPPLLNNAYENPLVWPDSNAIRFKHLVVNPQVLEDLKKRSREMPGVDPPPPPPKKFQGSGVLRGGLGTGP